MTKFRNLSIGDTFDFINQDAVGQNSFFKRCRKIGPRRYESVDEGFEYRIGSVACEVFHVERAEESNG